jgi:drug/metabolite transporter (DMT)-like permease
MISGLIGRLPGTLQAAFWMLVIGTLSTFTLVFARQVSPDIHVFEIVFFRSLFGLVFMLPWLARRGVGALRIGRPALIALRGLLAFFGGASMFYAATLLPLAEITAITFSRPIFASIAAVLFLGEIIRMRRWTAIFLGLAGALIIVRPGFATVNIGVAFAFVTVATLTWNSINLKLLTRSETPDAVAVWHIIAMLPMGLIACLFVWTTPTLEQLGWMLAIGACEMVAQRSMSRGYAAADITVVVAFSFLRLPVAAVLGFALFDEAPVIWVWLGAGVIAVSSIYIAHRETVLNRNAGVGKS